MYGRQYCWILLAELQEIFLSIFLSVLQACLRMLTKFSGLNDVQSLKIEFSSSYNVNEKVIPTFKTFDSKLSSQNSLEISHFTFQNCGVKKIKNEIFNSEPLASGIFESKTLSQKSCVKRLANPMQNRLVFMENDSSRILSKDCKISTDTVLTDKL